MTFAGRIEPIEFLEHFYEDPRNVRDMRARQLLPDESYAELESLIAECA